MNARRFFLRLAVALVTFFVGVTAAALFGATPRGWFDARHAPRVVVIRGYGGDFDPRLGESPLPPCGSYRMRHAFGWHEKRAGEFDSELPPPPPPAPPRPAER